MGIGEKIKSLRKDNNLTQDELANKLMVSRRTIIDWEKDKYHPQTELLLKICNVFNIPLSELTNTTPKVDPKSNAIRGNFVCVDKKIYKDEKKRLKGKYKNRVKKSDRIAMLILSLMWVSLLIINTILKDIEISLLIIVVSVVMLVVSVRILNYLKSNDLINRYEYIKYNNEKALCLSPYIEVVANVLDRLVITYNKELIINVSLEDISDIRLFRDSMYFPSYYPNDYDNKTYIYGMHIVYKDNTISKIAFAVINGNTNYARCIMRDAFNMLKSSVIKRGC